MATVKVEARRAGLYYPYWVDEADAGSMNLRLVGIQHTAREVLNAWAMDAIDFDRIPCIQCPLSICALILRGEWKDLLCLARWEQPLKRAGLPRPFGDWPDSAWMHRVSQRQPFAPCRKLPALEGLESMQELLLQFVAPMQQHLPEVEWSTSAAKLETVLTELEHWKLTAAEVAGQHPLRSADGRSHLRYSSVKLVECLRLCRTLKGGARRLAFVIERAMNIVPGVDVQCKKELPSASTMQRYELSFDVALMLWRADRWKGFARWMWMDSSPQKNYDWVWSEYDELPRRCLIPVFQAVVSLSAMLKGMTDVPDELDQIFEEDFPEEWWTEKDWVLFAFSLLKELSGG